MGSRQIVAARRATETDGYETLMLSDNPLINMPMFVFLGMAIGFAAGGDYYRRKARQDLANYLNHKGLAIQGADGRHMDTYATIAQAWKQKNPLNHRGRSLNDRAILAVILAVAISAFVLVLAIGALMGFFLNRS